MDARIRSSLSRRDVLLAGLLASVGAGRAPFAAAAAASSSASASRAPSAAGEPLITKPIPSTGERLPVIGLGTDSFREDERAHIRDVIARMHRLGGTVIDTSSDYGASEALIGDALADSGLRSSTFLATKLTDGRGFFGGIGGAASFERSLKRLRTRKVDLLQVHNLQGVDALMPLLRKWKREGRIRYYGITTSRPFQHRDLVRYMQRYALDFIQVDYSIADRDAERQIFPLAVARKIAVLVNLPLVHGQLMRRAAASKLPAWAGEIGVGSWAQFLLKYVVSNPAVTCAIPGTTKVAHLVDDQGAGRGTLPDAAARKRMEEYWSEVVS